MNTVYFNLLKYVHSPFLGEEINVGILFYFPAQRRLIFRYSTAFRRLRLLYAAFSEAQLRTYLQALARRVAQADRAHTAAQSLEQYAAFIRHDLLPPDATALQFGPLRQAVAHAEQPAEVAHHYFELFFPPIRAVRRKHDEAFLRQQFRTLLRDQAPEVLPLLQTDRVVATADTEIKFDFAWQNGALNLVKPLSFDLLDKADINRKAVHCCGWLYLLEKEARAHNYQFDLLIARPHARDLFSEYDNALKILTESTAPKRLVTEKDLEDYTAKAVQALREHSVEAA